MHDPDSFTPDPNAVPRDHPWNIHTAIYGFAGASLGLTSITMVTRIYTKCFVMRARGFDDALMTFGWLGFVFQWAVLLAAVNFGAGMHQQDVPASKIVMYSKLLYIHELMYPWIMGELKTSIGLQLLRLFVPNAQLREKLGSKFWSIWTFMLLQNLWFVAYFFASLFQCWPITKTWDFNQKGSCADRYPAFNVAVSAFNMVTDLLMVIVPLYWIWHLHLPKLKRIGAMGVFLVALLGFAASLLRLIFAVGRLNYTDITLTVTQVALATAAEEVAAILVGNCVSLPRFLHESQRKYRKSRSKSISVIRSEPDTEERQRSVSEQAINALYPPMTPTTEIGNTPRLYEEAWNSSMSESDIETVVESRPQSMQP